MKKIIIPVVIIIILIGISCIIFIPKKSIQDSTDKNNVVKEFREKTKEDGDWINAGFMVLEPEMIDLIEGDSTVFEKYPLEEAARRGELCAYKHDGFWQCMDTLRDKQKLEELWASGESPWKVW